VINGTLLGLSINSGTNGAKTSVSTGGAATGVKSSAAIKLSALYSQR